jgi:hypothetical protein
MSRCREFRAAGNAQRDRRRISRAVSGASSGRPHTMTVSPSSETAVTVMRAVGMGVNLCGMGDMPPVWAAHMCRYGRVWGI